jgi:outer membrane protein assembly factor BamE (lipoprotein component of BamABCDE complex)
MKNRFKRTYGISLFLLMFAPLLFLGCARVGHEFDSHKVQRVEVGKTTQSEVLSMFGEPWRTGLENGVRTWTYGHYTYRLIGNADTKDLVIKFSSDKVVSSYTFNETAD